MTFEEWTTQELVNNGMFLSQAAEVLALAKADKVLDGMNDRWNDDISEYPTSLMAVFWLSIKHVAIRWIKENKPLAWFRPMFEE